MLPKIHKRLENVPGRPFISKCGTPVEKVSEFFDSQLKPVMQSSQWYIKEPGDFIKKTKKIGTIPKVSNLITADVVVLYSCIPLEAGLKALGKTLNNRANKKVSTEYMAKFVLNNNYFEFNGKVKQQTLGTAIETKFAPHYACIFIDKVETSFLETQEMKPLVWFRYIDDAFFIWTHGQDKPHSLYEEFIRDNYYLKFTYELSKTSILFLDLKISLSNGDLSTDFLIKSTDRHQFLHYTLSQPDHTKCFIIYCQALGIIRMCSNKSDFLKHLQGMKSWSEVRGYPNKLAEQEKQVKLILLTINLIAMTSA